MYALSLSDSKKQKGLSKSNNHIFIDIPTEWYYTKSTYDFVEKNSNQLNIINFNSPQNVLSKTKLKPLPIPSNWNAKNGDYRVQESRTEAKDYVYYRDLKIKILKNSIYPVLFISILLVLKVSEVLSKM
jgi:hypothetical protein